MFHSVRMHVAGTAPRGPARRSLVLGASLLGLSLLTGCPQTPPQAPALPPAADNELHFDQRYYDSIDMKPRSARTERELAIFTQLQRLEMAKPPRNSKGKVLVLPKQSGDSIYEQIGEGNPARGFANETARLADIHRKIDSLKVLEHIPLTQH